MITINNIADTGASIRCRRLVIKLGSNVVLAGDRRVDGEAFLSLALQIVTLRRAHDLEILIVTSGAVGLGCGKLALPRPGEMAERQAMAAIGQIALMRMYEETFDKLGVAAAQVLLTRDDLDDPGRSANLHQALETLFKLRAIPVVNENDTVSTDELSFGDNDQLSAKLAVRLPADLLIILSTVDGVLDMKNPGPEGTGAVIPVIRDVASAKADYVDKSRSDAGLGGMDSKLSAAEMAASRGIPAIIANGKRPNILMDIASGRFVGTYLPPSRK